MRVNGSPRRSRIVSSGLTVNNAQSTMTEQSVSERSDANLAGTMALSALTNAYRHFDFMLCEMLSWRMSLKAPLDSG